MSAVRTTSITIQSGQSLSSIFDLPGPILGFYIPANWTAAPISMATDPTLLADFQALYEGGGYEWSLNVTAGKIEGTAKEQDLANVRRGKLRSGTEGTPVGQVNGVTIWVIYRDDTVSLQ